MLLVLPLCSLLLGQGAISYKHCINSATDLIQFSNNVNSGTNYSGTTVFLDADIDLSGDLSEQFEPIGKYDTNNPFQGTFDGQGYTTSNLLMNSSSHHIGLFGFSNGATIRNVIVMDSSYSFVSSYSGLDNIRVGGIAGRCERCAIENIVNMASVSFT